MGKANNKNIFRKVKNILCRTESKARGEIRTRRGSEEYNIRAENKNQRIRIHSQEAMVNIKKIQSSREDI